MAEEPAELGSELRIQVSGQRVEVAAPPFVSIEHPPTQSWISVRTTRLPNYHLALPPQWGPGGKVKVQEVLRCRYSNSDQLRDLLGQLLHDLDGA